MNNIHANKRLQKQIQNNYKNNYKIKFAIALSDAKVINSTNPSSLGERAQSRLGNKVALAFLGKTSPISAVNCRLSAWTPPCQDICRQPMDDGSSHATDKTYIVSGNNGTIRSSSGLISARAAAQRQKIGACRMGRASL